MATRLRIIAAFFALIACVLSAVLAGAGVGGAAAPTPVGVVAARQLDRDCSDFSTQAAAQKYFLDQGGPRQDPDALDADGDGVACESNPCPCSTSQGGGGGSSGPKLPPRKIDGARVVRVVDGDTVEVRVDGRKATVRMIGIDTPEVFGGVECGGRRASAYLKKALPRNTRVTLVSDRTQDLKDRYGRQLRYIFKNGRKDMNRAQLAVGNAKVYVFQNNRFELFKRYAASQAEARRRNRGIWKACRGEGNAQAPRDGGGLVSAARVTSSAG